MGVQSAATTRASRNRIGACTRGLAFWMDLAVRVDRGGIFLFLPWLARLVSLSNVRVSADERERGFFGFNRCVQTRPTRVLYNVYKRFRHFSSSPKQKKSDGKDLRLSQKKQEITITKLFLIIRLRGSMLIALLYIISDDSHMDSASLLCRKKPRKLYYKKHQW